MKRLSILAVSILLLTISSCIDDKGNYSYKTEDEVFGVSIDEFPKDTTVIQGSTLKLTAGVDFIVSNDDSSRYTYKWSVTEASTQGFLPTRTYIGEEENLNYVVTLAVGTWTLTFQIFDENLDIYKKAQMTLTVTASPLAAGWYVLKDSSNITDFDYIATDGTMYTNILGGGGHALQGQAVCMEYQANRYYHLIENPDGTTKRLNNQSVFHILSTEDISTFNAKDLTQFKTFETEFYTAPEVCKPQDICFTPGRNLFMLNDYQLYSIYGMSMNIGKFGAAKVGTLNIYPCIVPNYSNAMVFEQNSKSFMFCYASNSTLSSFTGTPGNSSLPSVENMPYTMIKMVHGMMGTYQGGTAAFAIMKGDDDGKYYLCRLVAAYGGSYANYPIASFVQIPDNSQLLQNECLAAPATGDFVYYSIGNKLYTYINAPGIENRDQLQLTLPEDEKISYIFNYRDMYYLSYNYLAVLSNNASGWILRIYNPAGVDNVEINTTPVATYSGTGTGRFILHRVS